MLVPVQIFFAVLLISLLLVLGTVAIALALARRYPGFYRGGWEKMSPILTWGFPVLLLLAGLTLLFLKIAAANQLLTPNVLQIGDVSVDGQTSPSHSQLLQARYDTLLGPSQETTQNVGFFEVAVPNAGELLGKKPESPATTDFNLTVKGVDVSGLAKLVYQLANPPKWSVEAEAQSHSDRVILHARLMYGKQTKHRWYLEAEGDLNTEKNQLVERLIDDLIFHLVFYLRTCEEKPLKTWAENFAGFPPNIGAESLRAYGVGRHHLERYYRSRSVTDLELARDQFELLNEQESTCLDGLLCLGVVLAESRREDEAISIFKQAMTLLEPPSDRRDAEEVRRRLRLGRIELAIASAEMRHFNYDSAHRAVNLLNNADTGLIQRLARERRELNNMGLTEESHEKFFFDYTELLAHAFVELSHAYGLYISYVRHTHMHKALEHADDSIKLDPGNSERLDQLDKQIKKLLPQAEVYWQRKEEGRQLRQRLGTATDLEQNDIRAKLDEIDKMNLPPEFEKLVDERFQLVNNAVAKIVGTHEKWLREAEAQYSRGFLDVSNKTRLSEPVATPVRFPLDANPDDGKTLDDYLSQDRVPNGEQRKRHIRFQLLNVAGYTRFRKAAFPSQDEKVEDLLSQADEFLSLAQTENPGHYQVCLNRGMVYLDRRYHSGEKVDVAERYLRRAVALKPTDYYSREQLALALRRRLELTGIATHMKKTVEEGRDEAQESIKLRHNSWNSHVLRAEFYAMLWELEENGDERKKLGAEIDGALSLARRFQPDRYDESPYPTWEWVNTVRDAQKLKDESQAIVKIADVKEKQEREAEFIKSKAPELLDRIGKLIIICEREAAANWLAQDFAAYYRFVQRRARALKDTIEAANSRPDKLIAWGQIRIPFSDPGDR